MKYLLFGYYLPIEKGMTLHLNKFESTSLKDDLIVPSLVEIAPVVLEKKIFFQYYQFNFTFLHFLHSPLGEGHGLSLI